MRGAVFTALACAISVAGCGRRPAVSSDGATGLPSCGPQATTDTRYFPQWLSTRLDILLVISTAAAMKPLQGHLTAQVPSLVDGLRSPGFLAPGCRSPLCAYPDYRIGVISADLGTGSRVVPGCSAGGDGAKLLRMPLVDGCTPPTEAWIAYADGKTNVPGPGDDPVGRVKDALRCVVPLGGNGCLFQQPLEAARRALDPALHLNPGFLREDAALLVLFLSSEDDCSAVSDALYDPALPEPLTSFRCAVHGWVCDEQNWDAGTKHHCVPGQDTLRDVTSYVEFFRALKAPGRAWLVGVAGPVEPVVVGLGDVGPMLVPSCQSQNGAATPALRLKAVIEGVGNFSAFNVDPAARSVAVDICADDLSPALHQSSVWSDGSQCLAAPPLTDGCGLVCVEGVALGGDSAGPVQCQSSCLDRAECIVEEAANLGATTENRMVVPKCPAATFTAGPEASCEPTCPCWRLRSSPGCTPARDGSPYEIEILRNARAAPGSVAVVNCLVSSSPWAGGAFVATEQCR